MFGSGRTVGIIIIVGGILLACGGSAISIASVSADPNGSLGGSILGVIISLIIAFPIIGLGAFLFWRGQKEIKELVTIQKQKQILNMVKTQGQ
ncbi:MAG: hypothetical protein GWN00_38805, partial [Aliifodinibius sp.]|nr:hypothetical protein [Fodinibius sp.]NIY30519.1 hypothetical protein [Fodinibius sp.]